MTFWGPLSGKWDGFLASVTNVYVYVCVSLLSPGGEYEVLNRCCSLLLSCGGPAVSLARETVTPAGMLLSGGKNSPRARLRVRPFALHSR